MSRTEIVSRGKSAFVDGFELFDVKLLNDIMLRVAMGGRGDKAPLLMVHGHPHTHVIWRKVAPALSKDRQVILVDLRGYGDSTKPESTPDHRPYSKREMARDLQLLLQSLGIEQCDFVGHDRGGRVGHRFALDWPELVRKAVFIDIAPTATMYERTDKEFATRYFWWFFLIQPDNLSVLSPEVIRGRVRSLTMLLSTQPSLEILALDSRESFQRNKEYYLRRLEEETEPAVRELLDRDMAHLDAIQFSSASSRKFVLVLPLDEKAGADESALRQLEKAICDHGLRVRLAEEQDVKRLLAIYYRQDLTTEVFRDFDGEEYVHG